MRWAAEQPSAEDRARSRAPGDPRDDSASDTLRCVISDIVRAVRAADERQIGHLLTRFTANADLLALFALRDALADAAIHHDRQHP
ncbi:hypothetical protein [Streptomyces melanogenes]|uniref:hypothetical protein n=1 Tax=Streptomyces melanogenes TaxID=67326 RepID=UPI00167EB188|nr:hypothetical protein [Streptomyces melanogenes]GGP56256.1 hypothetical protein GCM10010278_36510 [Streptomyces melanogenes]